MKTATITETKNHLSALINAVRRGETVIVLDRSKPVARIERIAQSGSEKTDARMERLQREGVILGPQKGRLKTILERRPPRPERPVSVVELLCNERVEGR